MSTLQKYVESSNADLRAEAVMNTLQNKILKKAKPPTENEQVKQELKQKNKAYTNELKAEANLGAMQKKMMTKAKRDNPEFNTYQKLADRDRADLAFEIQLKTISDNATKKPSDIKAEPMTAVTQAMIEDYQAEQMQPIEVEGQFFKYHPAGADTVALNRPTVERELTADEIVDLKDGIDNAADDIEGFKENISRLNVALEDERRKYDEEVAKNETIADAVKKTEANKTSKEAFTKIKDRILANIQTNRFNIRTKETEIEANYQELKDNDDRIKKNRQEEFNVNQSNKNKLDELTSLLMSLNRAKNLVIGREVGESDDEYLQRLKDIGAVTYSAEEVRDLANIKNIGQTKQNLKSFFSDDGRISTIAKMLSPDEKFKFNKLFLKVKKSYLEVYGFNNKQVSNEDVVDFINAIDAQPIISSSPSPTVTKDDELKAKYGSTQKSLAQWAVDEGIIASADGLSLENIIDQLHDKDVIIPEYFIKNIKDGKLKRYAEELNFKLLSSKGAAIPEATSTVPSIPEAAAVVVGPELVQAEIDYEKLYGGLKPGEGLKQFARDFNVVGVRANQKNEEVIKLIHEANIKIPKYFIDKFKNAEDQAYASDANAALEKKQKRKNASKTTGSGLKKSKSKPNVQGVHVREVPHLMKLGKIYITADQLYYHNLLGVRNKNNRQVTGVTNIIVSDTLVHLLFKVLDGGHLTKSDLSILKPSEKVVYDKLMKLSGLHKTMINSVDETLSEMKKRLELISGEIEAGNNNKELLKEAHGILFSMAQMNVITHAAASKYYKDLKSFF